MHGVSGTAALVAMAPLIACNGRARDGSDQTKDRQALEIPRLE